jgi:hypothetical protein
MAFISPKHKLSAVIFGLTLFLLSAANVSLAKDITLTWDANQESDVAFYNVYLKDMETQETWQEPGPAHDPAASTISQQIFGLDGTRQYCFQVTALNDSSIESSPSSEVCTVVAPVASDSDGDGYSENQGDCNDADFDINPGAAEVLYNAIDENCNGMADDVIDADADGFNSQDDCNDNNPAINPGATDICGQVDQNCDKVIDACPVEPLELLNPIGGEQWSSSSEQTISWNVGDTPSPVDIVVIEYSRNGRKWKTLKTLNGTQAQATSTEVVFPTTRKSKKIAVMGTIKNAQGVVMGKKTSRYLTLTR